MTTSIVANWISGLVFILGASDPEMACIETAIRNVGKHYGIDPVVCHAGFAGADGIVARCHGGVAYKATHLFNGEGCVATVEGARMFPVAQNMSGGWIYRTLTPVHIECEVKGLDRTEAYVIDHHREGDPGYDKPASQYWEASSIGQLWKLFLDHGVDPVAAAEAFGEERFLIAASDHCPSHAFQGRCPGIDIAALTAMRARNSAAFNKQTPEEWLLVVNAAIEKLKELPVAVAGGQEYRVSVEDIPLLNHAQLIAGLPVQYVMAGTPRDPRTKVGLLGGEPELISAWMAEKRLGELVDVYGDPARDYAGGYLPS